jgi:hypothetical protein
MKKRLLTPSLSHFRALVVQRALVIQLLLALVLLVAQSAAQAHVYSHLRSDSQKSDFNGTASRLCSECLSSAPLLSAAGSPDSPRIAFVAEGAVAITVAVAPRFELSHYYAFRSRAPPELL